MFFEDVSAMTEADREIIVDYQRTFATPEGKRVLDHMKWRAGMTWCKVSKTLPIEPNRVIWNEAQREFVLGTLKNVEFDFSKETVQETK